LTFSVAHTAEFQRVASLPRRAWTDGELADLARELTALLRTPNGEQALRPVQALALHDAAVYGGLFGAIGVGEGKTLVSFLLSLVWGAERPLLLMPATLIPKTQRDRLQLSKHWRVPTNLRVFSYELLGRVQSVGELEKYQPDALILEEGHRAKNKRAAVTRRLARYMHDRPETKVAVLSGTIMDKSLKDFAHTLIWSLKLGAPVPTTTEEIEEWAQALDQLVDPMARRAPGALLEFAAPEEEEQPAHVAARHGFRRRLVETPGVVATVGEGEHVDCSIYVRPVYYDVKPVTDQHIAHLRETWCTPDDWQLMLAAEKWAHTVQMALGLFYAWDPRPPDEWRNPRKAWNAFVREVIAHGRTYDSERHVADAVYAGELRPKERQELGFKLLADWRKVRHSFIPNVVPVWFDDSALECAADWMKKPGLVWTEHAFFAHKLSKLTGCPYYGAKSEDAAGRSILDAKPGESAIASIDANREGKNLQAIWSRCLFVAPPSSASWMEQAIARIHRPGQISDQVEVDVLLGCRENYDAVMRSFELARAIQDTTGKRQKLLMADVLLPDESEVDKWKSPRWQK
jgi:hypothetical protein